MTSNIVVEGVLKVVISLALWLVVAKVFLYVGKKIFKDIIKTENNNKKKDYELNKEEWNKRIDTLEKLLIKYISMKDIPDKEIAIEYLFYSS
jgi:hypothetical protein